MLSDYHRDIGLDDSPWHRAVTVIAGPGAQAGTRWRPGPLPDWATWHIQVEAATAHGNGDAQRPPMPQAQSQPGPDNSVTARRPCPGSGDRHRVTVTVLSASLGP